MQDGNEKRGNCREGEGLVRLGSLGGGKLNDCFLRSTNRWYLTSDFVLGDYLYVMLNWTSSLEGNRYLRPSHVR